MKIVCISDTHNRHTGLQVPAGDVLIHSGNHDWIFQKRRRKARAMVPDGIIYLEDEGVTLDGVQFWGSPVTPIFNDWAFMYGPFTIGTYWDAIPDNIDVLITHGPAYGVLDAVLADHQHVGCPHLRAALDTRLHPKLHVFGHIHEGYGVVEAGELTSVNASVLDAEYRLRNAPVVVDL